MEFRCTTIEAGGEYLHTVECRCPKDKLDYAKEHMITAMQADYMLRRDTEEYKFKTYSLGKNQIKLTCSIYGTRGIQLDNLCKVWE